MTEVSHPIFARAYACLSGRMERELWRYRSELVGDLSGRILEVGAGDGRNFPQYGEAAGEVVAVEPEPYLRAKAQPRADAAPIPITLTDGTAGSLPFEHDSFDVAVVCLVLCSVTDQQSALAEIKRVLKPDGTLRFFEHVKSDSRRKARIQSGLDRSGIWPRISGGCHCSCDTETAIETAGFEITAIRHFETRPTWGHTSPSILGSARVQPPDQGSPERQPGKSSAVSPGKHQP